MSQQQTEERERAESLYEIAVRYRESLSALNNLDLPEEVIADTIESVEGELTVKAQNVIAFAANLDAQAEAVGTRIKQLQAWQRALDRRSEWLRRYTLEAMQAAGVREIKCGDFIAKPRQNPPRVVIDNEAGIPAELWREKIVREPDKSAISAKLKAGEPLEFAHLEQTWRLEIK